MPTRYTTSNDETNPWPDLAAIRQAGNLVLLDDPEIQFARVTKSNGRVFVAMRVDLPGGKVAVIRTSVSALVGAVEAIKYENNA